MAAARSCAVEADLLVHGAVPRLQHRLEAPLHETRAQPLVRDDPSRGLPHPPPVLRADDQRCRALGHLDRVVVDRPVPGQVGTTAGDLAVDRPRVAGGVASEEALEEDRVEGRRPAMGEPLEQDAPGCTSRTRTRARAGDAKPEPVAPASSRRRRMSGRESTIGSRSISSRLTNVLNGSPSMRPSRE